MSYSPVRVSSYIADSTFLVDFLTERSSSLSKFLGKKDRNVAPTDGFDRFSVIRGFFGKGGEFPHFFRKISGLRRLDRFIPRKCGEFPQNSLHKRSSHFGISSVHFVLITVCNLRISKLCQSRSWETTHSQDWGWHSFLGTITSEYIKKS